MYDSVHYSHAEWIINSSHLFVIRKVHILFQLFFSKKILGFSLVCIGRCMRKHFLTKTIIHKQLRPRTKSIPQGVFSPEWLLIRRFFLVTKIESSALFSLFSQLFDPLWISDDIGFILFSCSEECLLKNVGYYQHHRKLCSTQVCHFLHNIL